jgi:hypothetical protein
VIIKQEPAENALAAPGSAIDLVINGERHRAEQ